MLYGLHSAQCLADVLRYTLVPVSESNLFCSIFSSVCVVMKGYINAQGQFLVRSAGISEGLWYVTGVG